jgi:hypothetical protein
VELGKVKEVGTAKGVRKTTSRTRSSTKAAKAVKPTVVRKATSKRQAKAKATVVAKLKAKVKVQAKAKAKGKTTARVGRVASKAKRSKKKPGRVANSQPERFTIRELDPVRKCGPGTSVEQLYRIDERADGEPVRTHLVFFDRHGWYCEHGRDCAAVAHARKHGDRARRHGPTQNGRMRA